MTDPINIVISFDTTGSMYPCLSEVRRKVADTVQRLFKEIPKLRIGVIAHGDYCDRFTSYVTKHLQLTDDPNQVINFVKTVSPTGGGDAPECYELVLREARQMMKWQAGAKKVLVMIGDDVPHPAAHTPDRIDWRKELSDLTEDGILVHGVQCLNRYHASDFWKTLPRESGGAYLSLNQFHEATELLIAVAYQQQGAEYLQRYEEEVVKEKKMTRSMAGIFDALSKRDPKTGRFRKTDARAVAPGRFQTIAVDYDTPIKDLVTSNGLVFEKGRGFYEFTKKETIQHHKEVIILNNETGDMYEGEAAREVLGLPAGTIDIKPDYDRVKYKVFVQSTSVNRKLIAGTTFLYEAK